MTTDNATDARNRWTEWPPVPRPTTSGSVLAAFAAGKPTTPEFTRCACGIAIHPDYTQCETCEYNECPNCGIKNHGFCQRCIENDDKTAVINGSERWAARLQS